MREKFYWQNHVQPDYVRLSLINKAKKFQEDIQTTFLRRRYLLYI